MKKILVVDDNKLIQDTLQDILETEGYQVLIARDGIEALLRLKQELPALIVLDIMMPHLDGVGFLEELRRRGLRGSVPILALSATSYAREKVQQAGVSSYMEKPVDMLAFLDEVGRLCGTP